MKYSLYVITTLLLSVSIATVHAVELQQIENQISDSFITTVITAKYAKSTNLNPLKIHVSTDNGVVYLNGHVKNKKSFMEALNIVKDTNGVSYVNTDKLEIRRANTSLADVYITTKVEAMVLKEKLFSDETLPLAGINAHTKNGVVTLKGIVKSKHSIINLTKNISKLTGVKRVISKLQVNTHIA